MTDNIQAFNLRLAKEKRRIGNAKGTLLTKAAITKQAVINLRLRDPERLRRARQAVKRAIIDSGNKLSWVKSRDIDNAARGLIIAGDY
jgi:hypothetical protein